jgi:hypothetical protein
MPSDPIDCGNGRTGQKNALARIQLGCPAFGQNCRLHASAIAHCLRNPLPQVTEMERVVGYTSVSAEFYYLLDAVEDGIVNGIWVVLLCWITMFGYRRIRRKRLRDS